MTDRTAGVRFWAVTFEAVTYLNAPSACIYTKVMPVSMLIPDNIAPGTRRLDQTHDSILPTAPQSADCGPHHHGNAYKDSMGGFSTAVAD